MDTETQSKKSVGCRATAAGVTQHGWNKNPVGKVVIDVITNIFLYVLGNSRGYLSLSLIPIKSAINNMIQITNMSAIPLHLRNPFILSLPQQISQ